MKPGPVLCQSVLRSHGGRDHLVWGQSWANPQPREAGGEGVRDGGGGGGVEGERAAEGGRAGCQAGLGGTIPRQWH